MRGFASLFGRQGVLAAASAALIVLCTQIVLQLLSTLLGAMVFVSNQPGQYLSGYAFPMYVYSLVLGSLPFVIGVFLSLWLLAPVAAELPIVHVISRALLAVAAGALIVFITQLVGSLFTNFHTSDALVFGWATGLFSTLSSNADWAFVQSLYTALSTAINLIPLAVLACVLLWIWLRAHPVPEAVEASVAQLAAEV